jgi:hypothetical protein
MAAAMDVDEETVVSGSDKSGNKKRFEVKKVKKQVFVYKRCYFG